MAFPLLLIPAAVAAWVAYDASKKPGSKSNPISQTLTATQKEELNFLNWLQDLVRYYKSKGGDANNLYMGDLGYVRGNRAFNNLGQRWYITPAMYNPLNNERIGCGNFTDMVGFILNLSETRKVEWGFTSISLAKRQAMIFGFFSQPGFNDTIGPAGPHSTYLNSLFSSIDMSKLAKALVDIPLLVAGVVATVASAGAAAPADIILLQKLNADFS